MVEPLLVVCVSPCLRDSSFWRNGVSTPAAFYRLARTHPRRFHNSTYRFGSGRNRGLGKLGSSYSSWGSSGRTRERLRWRGSGSHNKVRWWSGSVSAARHRRPTVHCALWPDPLKSRRMESPGKVPKFKLLREHGRRFRPDAEQRLLMAASACS
jgi:hypothetical protein